MTALPFVPEQTLRTRCEPVYSVIEARQIIRELEHWYERLAGECVGLAAPQIGIPKSVAIVRAGGQELDLINPRMVKQSDPFVFNGEGCLSFPARRWDVPRFKTIELENHAIWPPDKQLPNAIQPKVDSPIPLLVSRMMAWLYEDPNEGVPNLMPIVIQHEYDHILGICLPWKEGAVESAPLEPAVKAAKVGRNDPCPCGSSKKFKRCCLGKIPQGAVAIAVPPL